MELVKETIVYKSDFSILVLGNMMSYQLPWKNQIGTREVRDKLLLLGMYTPKSAISGSTKAEHLQSVVLNWNALSIYQKWLDLTISVLKSFHWHL